MEVVLLKNIQESKALVTISMESIRELHVLQAHLLHYSALLHSFEASVQFIAHTHNPAMDSSDVSAEQRAESKELMKRESKNLLSEIDCLEKRRMMLSNQLKNVMDLSFATINIHDSRQAQQLTEAMVRDSATMVTALFWN